jgi:O-Antigen ligase
MFILMSFAAGPPAWNRRIRSEASEPLAPIIICVLFIPIAVVLAEILSRYPLSWGIAIAGAVFLGLAMTLVIGRYEVAVSIGFLLSGVVLIEPAPSDVLFGLVMAVAFTTGRFRFPAIPRSIIVLVSAFLLLNVISAASVVSWSAAGRFFLITFYLAIFSLWLAGYVDRSERARRIVRAYLAAAIFSAVIGTLALFVPFPDHNLLLLGGKRAKGLFKDPNVYGPFLIPIALIVAEEIFHPRLLRLRTSLRILSFLILTIGVFFSYSRAAWLNFSIGLIVLIVIVVMRRPDRKAISLVLVVLVGASAVIGVIFLTGSLRFLHERAQRQSYDTERFFYQARGVSVGLSHLFGLGPGQFNAIYSESTYNLFIRALAEQGVLGLAVMIGLVGGTLLFGLINALRGKDTHGISAAALLGAWCGLIANSYFVDTSHWRHLWLVAGLIWAGAIRKHHVSPSARLPVQAQIRQGNAW